MLCTRYVRRDETLSSNSIQNPVYLSTCIKDESSNAEKQRDSIINFFDWYGIMIILSHKTMLAVLLARRTLEDHSPAMH